MTKEQLHDLIERKKDHTQKELALIFNLNISTLRYWLRRARAEGLDVPPNKEGGRKPLKLK